MITFYPFIHHNYDTHYVRYPKNQSNRYGHTQSYAHLITERHAMVRPHTHHPYQLGASLYMPATRQDISQVIKRDSYRRLIVLSFV